MEAAARRKQYRQYDEERCKEHTSKKRLTNHSVRKTVVKKLRAASVERQSIIQVTGHAKEKSLNDYDEGSEKEQHISALQHYQHASTVSSFEQFLWCTRKVVFSRFD